MNSVERCDTSSVNSDAFFIYFFKRDPLRGKWEMADLKQHVHKKIINTSRNLSSPRRSSQEPTSHRNTEFDIAVYRTSVWRTINKNLDVKFYRMMRVS